MNDVDPNEILRKATVELQNGNLAAGEKILQECLAVNPNYGPALDLAARAALLQSQNDVALSYAQRAVAQKPLAMYVVTLAEALKANNKPNEALNFFRKVLAKEPREYRSLVGVADIYEQAGYIQLAAETYGAAADANPKSIDAAIKYSRLLPIPDLPKGLLALDRAKPPSDAPTKARLGFLEHYVTYKEWAERVRHGMMPYHVTSLDEAFFKFAARELDEFADVVAKFEKEYPDKKGILISKASNFFCRGRRLEAENYYKGYASLKPDSIYEVIEFSPDFYQRIASKSDDDLRAGLPPVVNLVHAEFSADPIIYLSCNYDYFADFGRPMLLSINEVARNAQVHLHIMDPPPDIATRISDFQKLIPNTNLAVSAETVGVIEKGVNAARCYYHAVRFIRLYDHLKHYRRPLWLMDVDAVLNRDPQVMFESASDADIAFRARPGRWEPWNQHNASVLGINPTPLGFEYLRLVAAYVAEFYAKDRLRWGIDQLAMYGVHEYMRDAGRAPNVKLLDDRAVDYEANDDGFVWCNSGKGKFEQIQRLKLGKEATRDPGKAKYLAVFKKYIDQLSGS
jgi:tetratricopeptide (TPR) repeat protein